MATGEPSPRATLPPLFQITLRDMMGATLVCAIALAIMFHWGFTGFALIYVGICVWAILSGLFGRKFDRTVGGTVALCLGACLCALMIPAVNVARESGQRDTCRGNLRNIHLALAQYENDYGSYPPTHIADSTGKPLHSWRVLLLPYLEQSGLYNQYRFDEPWDGPNNSKLHSTVMKLYSCPTNPQNHPPTETSYLAVVGPRTVWQDDAKHRISIGDIIDGISNMILLVEVADSGIHWMEPRDLHVNQMPMAINPARGQGISSYHPGGANVVFAGGRIVFLTNDTSPGTLRALLTRNGKEPPSLP